MAHAAIHMGLQASKYTAPKGNLNDSDSSAQSHLCLAKYKSHDGHKLNYKHIRDMVRQMSITACNLFQGTMNIQHIEYLENCQTSTPDPWYLL